MSAINRRSQKVACVIEVEICDMRGNLLPGPCPEMDRIYTVADFVNNGGYLQAPATSGFDPSIGLDLVELPAARVRTRGGRIVVIGWPVGCSRPVDERKTDIGNLIRIGRDVRESEDA